MNVPRRSACLTVAFAIALGGCASIPKTGRAGQTRNTVNQNSSEDSGDSFLGNVIGDLITAWFPPKVKHGDHMAYDWEP